MLNGVMQLLASLQDPEQGADLAAASGLDPPDSMESLASLSLPPSLQSLLEPAPQSPFAGLQAPEAPQLQGPPSPGSVPGPGQLPTQSAILDLIMGKGSPLMPNPVTAAPPLSAFLR